MEMDRNTETKIREKSPVRVGDKVVVVNDMVSMWNVKAWEAIVWSICGA
jgi:hypothetical protein